MEIRKELFTGIIESFRDHLDLQGNHRILFSGRFGIGKTTFLRHYFEQENYNVIYLYPVNYSVLENEDIFSYVKYDILVSLLAKYDYPADADYHEELAKWPKFLTDNLDQVIATTMLLIPKMGKQLNQFVKELGTLKDAFDKINKSKKEQELDELNKYLTKFHQAEGGIYESNIVTRIIQEWLKCINIGDKRNILIIDDLDRIDPNHIFRLLNIFSAHFDSRVPGDTHNKFGFDQVLMVCDVSNIETIFRAQYGIRSDFNGYIDKFYSKEIYRFDNEQNILNILENILSQLKLEWIPDGDIVTHTSDSGLKALIRPILKSMVLSGLVNLRSLLKFYGQRLLLPYKTYRVRGMDVGIYDSYMLSTMFILAAFIGDLRLLKSKINLMKHLHLVRSDKPHQFLAELIYLCNNDLVSTDMLYPGGSTEDIPFDILLDKKRYSGEFLLTVPSVRERTMWFSSLNELKINDDLLYKRSYIKMEQYDAVELFKQALKIIE